MKRFSFCEEKTQEEKKTAFKKGIFCTAHTIKWCTACGYVKRNSFRNSDGRCPYLPPSPKANHSESGWNEEDSKSGERRNFLLGMLLEEFCLNEYKNISWILTTCCNQIIATWVESYGFKKYYFSERDERADVNLARSIVSFRLSGTLFLGLFGNIA